MTMYPEKVNHVWFLETTNGEMLLIISEYNGSWENILDAIENNDSLYGIDTTNTNTGLVNLIEMVCEYDKILFVDQREKSLASEDVEKLASFTLQFLDKDIASKDIQCLEKVFDRKLRKDNILFLFLNRMSPFLSKTISP